MQDKRKIFLYNFLTEERTDLDGYLVGNYNNLHFDGKNVMIQKEI